MEQAGRSAKATISNDINLNFDILFSGATIATEPLKANRRTETLQKPQNPPEVKIDGLEWITAAEAHATEEKPAPIKALVTQSQREAEDHKRTLEIYREHQTNTKKSEQLQAEILKGVKAGEDIYSLFLKAIEAISLMTANTCFRSQIEEDIHSIYGTGLHEKPPLELDLKRTQERLQTLTEAIRQGQSPEEGQIIETAIKAHKRRIAELEDILSKAS